MTIPKDVHGHKVVGHEILSNEENRHLVKLWVLGWWPNLDIVGDVRFIEGYCGQETELTTVIIAPMIVSPVHSFVVVSSDRIAAD